jgi:hypothetical protein
VTLRSDEDPPSLWGGGALVALGVLLLATCGSCTGLMLLTTIWSAIHGRQGGQDILPIVALVGGIPTLLGAGLLWRGLVILRKSGRRRPRSKAKTFD